MISDLLILILLVGFAVIYSIILGWHILLVNGKTKRKSGNVSILLISVVVPLFVALFYYGASFVHIFAFIEAAAVFISCLGFMVYTTFKDVKVGLR